MKCSTTRKNREYLQCIEDIRDGEEYQRLQHLHAQNIDEQTKQINLTITLNTDGVTLFSSSKKGNLWPVYLAINELPPKRRFSKKYLVPGFTYCHAEKPNMFTYLAPLMKTLESLHTEGFEVNICDQNFNVKVHLLAVTVDLPARAMLLNMKQYNGKFGCSVCLDESSSYPNLPMLRYYPYTENCQLRTHKSMLLDAKRAVEIKESVHRINGMCQLHKLKYVDIPKCVVIDWMHCVLLGVMKTELSLWLEFVYRDQSFHIRDKIALMNKRLQNIKIPDFVVRQQRHLDEYTHWKATECREWLLHYSVPVLNAILSSSEMAHHSLLVTAMFLLNKEKVFEGDIEKARDMLDDFCRLFPVIYNGKKQTMNVHMLRHLPTFVKLHGTLFNYSCFGFESMNSHLKSMVHGTRYINSQLSFAVGMTKCLPDLVRKTKNDDVKIKSLLQSLCSNVLRDEE